MIRAFLIGLIALALSTGASLALAADPLVTAPSDAANKSIPQVPWKKISGDDKRVLAMLEKDWDQLMGVQQRRLLGAAKAYPKLTPTEQQRFQARLREWVALKPDQREAARAKHRNLSSLPPEKQAELRQRWEQTHADKGSAQPTPTPSAPK